MIHSCESCGLIHDDGVARTDPSVEIARIEAEARVAVARLEARSDSHVAEVEAESAAVVAEAEAEILGTILTAVPEPEPIAEPEPVVDSAPAAIIVDTDVEPEVPAPPVHEEDHHDAPKKRSGFGMW